MLGGKKTGALNPEFGDFETREAAVIADNRSFLFKSTRVLESFRKPTMGRRQQVKRAARSSDDRSVKNWAVLGNDRYAPHVGR